MASIQKRPNGSYRARYRDASGKEHARHFPLKGDAQAWLRSETSKINDGSWTDPARAKISVGVLAESWIKRRLDLKPSTLTRYDSIINRHVLPTWGDAKLSGVTYEGVSEWVQHLNESGLSASSVRQCYRVFSLILADAVKGRRLAINPADGVDLPRRVSPEKRFLTAGEVARLADAAGQYRAVILMLAYTGVRFGELAALRVKRVEMLRRRFEVAESVTEISGRVVFGTPKSHQSRFIPLPRFLTDEVAHWMEGKSGDDLVFTAPGGGVLRINNFRRRYFDPALGQAGIEGITPHDLRHTAASLAVDAGASVKDVQRMLGHASAAMTLDVYAGLFEESLDRVAERMDMVFVENSADYLRTEGHILPLDRGESVG